MKKLLCMLLALAACSAALCAAAAESVPADAPAEEPAFVRVWGTVSPWDGKGIFLKNEDQDGAMNEVVLLAGEETCAVDAATGLPLDLNSVKEGDRLYAWIGDAATMSLPPQVSARIIVGNVPEGAEAPEYCEIAGRFLLAPDSGRDGKNGSAPLTGGGTLTVTDETVYTPWLTRQIVGMDDLVPGARALVWKDKEGAAEKVLVFPYSYRGYLTIDAMPHGDLLVSLDGCGYIPALPYKRAENGVVLVPLRAIAEAAGYSVSWDKNRGAVVYDENVDLVFFAAPGEEVIFRDGGETGISAPCVLEKGVTYLPAEDLCYWLNLFFA